MNDFGDRTPLNPLEAGVPIIDLIPSLKPLLAMDGQTVGFQWKDRTGVSVDAHVMAVQYSGKTMTDTNERMAVLALEGTAGNYHPLACVDTQFYRQFNVGVISNGEDHIMSHPEVLDSLHIYRGPRGERLVSPFNVADRFKGSDLSQVVMACTQLVLDSHGFLKLAVHEDGTIKPIAQFPYVKSAYFKYSTPNTEFMPVESGRIPKRADGTIQRVYDIPTRLSGRQVELLQKAFT